MYRNIRCRYGVPSSNLSTPYRHPPLPAPIIATKRSEWFVPVTRHINNGTRMRNESGRYDYGSNRLSPAMHRASAFHNGWTWFLTSEIKSIISPHTSLRFCSKSLNLKIRQCWTELYSRQHATLFSKCVVVQFRAEFRPPAGMRCMPV